jgi:nitrilase
MKISVIQMNSQTSKADNIRQAQKLVADAVEHDRPDMVVLPEVWTMLGGSLEQRRAAAEEIPGGEAWRAMQEMGRAHKVYVHGGSMLEKAGKEYFNTTVAFDPNGNEIARYRKIHLFDVVTPDGKEYRESATFSRGSDVVTYRAEGHEIGASICYDLRFPELYQQLARKGAEIIMVPAAFTLQTGKDHWEVLLRARAIETETYVLAAAQCGTYANGNRTTYGHSLVVNPWGHVIARAYDKPGVVTARLDFGYLKDVRQMIPVQQHKVL